MDLTTVAAKAADSLKAFVAEKQDEIQQDISRALVEASLQDKPAKFRMNLSITLDMNKNRQDNDLSWGVRKSLSESSEIEDPKQQKLIE